MDFCDSSKSILENIYFLCAPFLVLVSVIGLTQLWIAKKTLRINSKRDAALLSIQLIEKNIPKIERQYYKITERLTELRIDYQKLEKLEIKEFTIQEIQAVLPDQYNLLEKHYEDLRFDYVFFLNMLETYSVPIINGIADDALSFNSECLSYIQNVKLSAYFIAKEKEEDRLKIIYENLIGLYRLWNDRVTAMRLDDVINCKTKERKNINTTSIKPIGVE